MKSKGLTLLCCLLSASMLFSQELDTLPSSIPLHALMTIHTPVITDKTPPLITIEGKEFNKFPTNNFLEAINAFFPWVYKTGNSYTYVVDGNVLQDINGLSLHDIEEVSFSRTNMDGRLYPFSRAGIFYIKTKRPRIADVAVNFNTQYNIASNDKKKLIIFTDPVGTEKETEVNNETGHLQSNHLSLSTKGKKLSFYSSVQFSSIKDPKLGQSGDFMVTTIPFSFGATDKTRQRNIGAFINLNYTISASFSAGLSANYFSSLNKADSSGFTEYTTSGNTNRAETAAKTKTSFTYYHISPYIAYQKGHLQNITRFEYANNEFQYDRQVYSVNTVSGASPSSFSSQAVETVKPYIRGYTIRNDLNYELIHKGKFTARPGVVFSYINQEIRYRQSETVWLSSNPIPGMFESWSYARQKITTLNPYLQLNFNNQFMGYAGHSFLLNKKNEIGVATTKHSRRSYYAGAVIDLVNLGIKKMDRLDVSFHYGNMTKNNSDNYWLQSVNNVDNFRPSGHFDGLYSGFPGKASFFRTIQTSVQINSAFLKNHVLLGAEWSRTVEDNRFLISIPIPPIYYTFVPGEVATTGWAAYASVHISSIRRFDWKSRINVLFPKIKYDIDYLASNISVVEYKCVTGWQNNFKFGGFYAQINAMLGIKRGDIPANPPTPFVEGATDFILNYIMLGHSLYNDKLNVFVHARNLLGTSKGKEYYGYNTYIGAGIQLAFR